MSFVSRFFSSVVLTIFGFFLFGLNFTSALEPQSTIIVTSGFGDTCNWNIQCEQIGKDLYVCHSSGTFFSSNTIIQTIPTGNCGIDTNNFQDFRNKNSNQYLREKKISYEGPTTFIYPFVRIIKIQV